MAKPIIALGIESSCDDTSAAVVTSDKQILSNIVLSQITEHAPYQGVVPEIAARSHMSSLETAITRALQEANLQLADIDLIAATAGPGLIGGLIVGTMFAKAISFAARKPYIAVNHLEGHLLTSRLFFEVEYPFITLLVSGGHAQFIAVLSHGDYRLLGQTLDDAPGEAFDKLAKMLNLGYPGGPIIEKLAAAGDEKIFDLPLSMVGRAGCDLSFSGLKTAARLLIERLDQDGRLDNHIADVAASFQRIVAEILVSRTRNAMEIFASLTGSANFSFVLSGGVAANQYLRNKMTQLAEEKSCTLYVPPVQYCTDNAAMIAWAGIENFLNGKTSSLDIAPRANWPLEELNSR